MSGEIIYDEGHVCTCTRKRGEGDAPDEYEPTVRVAQDIEPTESGSWYYVCSACGAGAWSGL